MTDSCKRCGRLTRPRNVSADAAPGTIIRYTADLCGTCYYNGWKGGEVRREPATGGVSATCIRCGYERPSTGSNSSVLCRDCRYVMTAEERALWVP